MHYLLKNRGFIIILFSGLIIRLILAFLPGFKIDMGDWYAWALRLSNFKFESFYSKDVFTDYTPGYLYILSFLGFLKNFLSITDGAFNYLLKIPAIIAELIIGILIYHQRGKIISDKFALVVSAFIILNPALIFNSSIWGQVDSILTLFMLLAIIFLSRGKFILSSFFFGIALIIKPQAVALIPLYALFLARNLNIKNIIKIIIPSLLIIFLLSLPFFPNQTLINLAGHILSTANQYFYTSLNAYNFWGIIGFWINDGLSWNSISYQVWGYIMLAVYWIIIAFFYIHKKISLAAVSTLAALGFFFLPTRVHERYLYPAIIFLILLLTKVKSRLIFALIAILSLFHLLNLYYVYVYYNELYFGMNKILYNSFLYTLVAGASKILSLASIILFVLISIFILKYEAAHKKN